MVPSLYGEALTDLLLIFSACVNPNWRFPLCLADPDLTNNPVWYVRQTSFLKQADNTHSTAILTPPIDTEACYRRLMQRLAEAGE